MNIKGSYSLDSLRGEDIGLSSPRKLFSEKGKAKNVKRRNIDKLVLGRPEKIIATESDTSGNVRVEPILA